MKGVADCSSLAFNRRFLNRARADELFNRLIVEHPWPANDYEVFGRRFTLPRLQTWHADDGVVYSYSDNLLRTQPWTPELLALRRRVERATGHQFNAVLVNFYRNGQDYVGWHSDDEVELGAEPVIASLSLGATRRFAYRRKGGTGTQCDMSLEAGSLLLMRPDFQCQWEHSVPATDDDVSGRINLTFRWVYPASFRTDDSLSPGTNN